MPRTGAAVYVLLLFVAACGNADPAATTSPVAAPSSPTATPKPTPDQGRFDNAKAMDHVRALSVDIGKREAGTEGDRIAGDYIRSALDRMGWTVTDQPFSLPQGGTSSNLIGIPAGFDETKPYLIIGGHRDSLNGPGSNDNATGVAIVLEIARALRARPAPLPVMAIVFGAEERQPAPGRPHHVGSIFYVDRMSPEARSNLVAMVNVDMVGHGDVIICARLAVGPREGTNRCLEKAKKLEIAARERVTPDWSDHGPFQKKGMNTAWLWTGENPCCYHNPQDTIDTVRPDDVRRSGILAMAIIRSYTGSL